MDISNEHKNIRFIYKYTINEISLIVLVITSLIPFFFSDNFLFNLSFNKPKSIIYDWWNIGFPIIYMPIILFAFIKSKNYLIGVFTILIINAAAQLIFIGKITTTMEFACYFLLTIATVIIMNKELNKQKLLLLINTFVLTISLISFIFFLFFSHFERFKIPNLGPNESAFILSQFAILNKLLNKQVKFYIFSFLMLICFSGTALIVFLTCYTVFFINSKKRFISALAIALILGAIVFHQDNRYILIIDFLKGIDLQSINIDNNDSFIQLGRFGSLFAGINVLTESFPAGFMSFFNLQEAMANQKYYTFPHSSILFYLLELGVCSFIIVFRFMAKKKYHFQKFKIPLIFNTLIYSIISGGPILIPIHVIATFLWLLIPYNQEKVIQSSNDSILRPIKTH